MNSNTIRFNPAVLAASTVAYLQAYNSGLTLIDQATSQVNATIGGINIHELPAQIMQVLTTSEFINDQSKQTFKRTTAYAFSKAFRGKALTYKGDSFKVHTLAQDETVDRRGKVVKIKSAEQIAADKAAADKAAAEKKAFDLEAQQAVLKLEAATQAKEQAENSAAIAAKQANEAKKAAISQVAKAETAAELLSKEVASLKIELERARHESSATVNEYRRLLDGIRTAKTLTEVKKLAGFTIPVKLQAQA